MDNPSIITQISKEEAKTPLREKGNLPVSSKKPRRRNIFRTIFCCLQRHHDDANQALGASNNNTSQLLDGKASATQVLCENEAEALAAVERKPKEIFYYRRKNLVTKRLKVGWRLRGGARGEGGVNPTWDWTLRPEEALWEQSSQPMGSEMDWDNPASKRGKANRKLEFEMKSRNPG
ncbi:uncharacterized protein LOC144488113 [Mustelus asterias]